MTPQELKNSILKKAFTGKLIESSFSNVEDETNNEEYPFAAPKYWKWKTFDQVCDMYTGNSIPINVKKQKYEGLKEGYDYIGTKDVGFDQSINYDNGVRIPFDTNFKIAKSNSILMCIEGGSAGRKIGMIDRDVCFGNKLCSFYSDEVLNKYIFYYLQSPLYLEEFSSNMTGIIGGVGIRKLKKIYIPIALPKEQKRIVEKIEELMPLVDEYEKNWEKLEKFNKEFPVDMKKSLIQEAIKGNLVEQMTEEGTGEELYKLIQEEKKKLIKEGKIKKQKALPEIKEEEIPFDIPESWKWVRLGDVINFTMGKTPPRSELQWWKPEIPWVSISDMEEDGFVLKTKEGISKEALDEKFNNNISPKGTLIMSFKLTVGRVSILEIDAVHNEAIISIYPFIDSDDIFKFYLFKILPFITKFGETKNAIKGKTLNSTSIKNLIIPLPPLQEQKRIVEKLEKLLPLCDRLIINN